MGILKDAWEGAKKVGKSVVSGAKSVGKAVVSGAKAVGKTLVRTASPVAGAIMDNAGELWSGTIEKLQGAKSVKTMSSEAKTMARLSNEAYNHPSKRQDLDGYVLDKELSGKRHAVYHHKDKNKSVIAFRGTVVSDMDDLHADTAITTGQQRNHHRFKEAEQIHDQVKNKYQGATIKATGHSLGGALAQHTSRVKGVEAEVFNAGIGANVGLAKDTTSCKVGKKSGYCDKVIRHHISGDPISAGGQLAYGKNHTYHTKGLDSHSLENFLD